MSNEISNPVTYNKRIDITRVVGVMGFVGHLYFLWLFNKFDITLFLWVNVGSISLFAAIVFLAFSNRKLTLAIGLMTFEVLTHQILGVYYFGWEYGFQYNLVILAMFLVLVDIRTFYFSLVASTVTFFTFVYLLAFGQYTRDTHLSIPSEYGGVLNAINLTGMFFVALYIPFIFARSTRTYERFLLDVQKKLLKDASTDPLTQLANRRSVLSILNYEIKRCHRMGYTFSVALGDIDDFKRINDTYGHDVGDLAIVSIGNTIKSCLRDQDVVGRWGGEEYLIILPETGLDESVMVVNRIKEKIKALRISAHSELVSLTMTFGVANLGSSKGIDEVLKVADLALYRGKRGTKNCVERGRKSDYL